MKKVLINLLQALINLLKVKSIITLVVLILFAILAFRGELETAFVAGIISSVLTYYFNKDKNKEE